MIQCRQCGAELPDEAKFCLHCGAPAQPPEPEVPQQPQPFQPPQPPPPLDFVQPALAGGMFLGLLSSLPIIQLGNCFCCMWVLAGGGIAAFLLTKQRPDGITFGDGAFGGVLSGLFGAVVATAVSIPVQVITARIFGDQRQALEQAMKDVPGWEGPLRDIMLRIASPEISALTVSARFFMNLIFFALFAMIGGILTVAVLNRRKKALT